MSRITISVEGGLLPDDLLEKIADGSATGQRAADFGITSGRVSDEIMRAFSDAQSYWSAFNHRCERASKGGRESITSVTRESFVIPLFEALGYDLQFKRSLASGEQSFNISHTTGDDPSAPPFNIISADDSLDDRGSARRSAHSAVQEYLNVSDCVWGVVTNGCKLRLLRNSSRLSKPRYIEFDVAGMMESNVYSDFHLLYRLLHRTRLPRSSADASECWLSKYYDEGVEQGSRVRDRLRDGVLDALNIFGNTFLTHPQSEYLREQFAANRLTPANYYRELLRLVYRLLFLMVAEERHLMFPDSRENQDRRAIFTEHYGVNRLRARIESYAGEDPEIDLWEGLKQTFHILRDDRAARRLGIAALNGELFGSHGCPHLDGGGDPGRAAFCRNDHLLRAIDCLSKFDDDGVRRRVNFGALDVEELGSVYESLLDYHPQISASPLEFNLAWGSERKSTGSYYTPPDLVRELINSALVPVMEERLKPVKTKEDREQAILAMRVIDPAAGSGHFLLAAARRMGRELAKIRTGEEEPPPSAFRRGVRDVIRECIYAVDKNPLAVDLCKVALWIEGHNAGQPLSFLDHHVKCGDSLVGVFDLKVLEEGIPDNAYKAVESDDKAAAKHYRALNRETRKIHPTLPQFQLPHNVIGALEALSHHDERTPDDVAAKEREYAGIVNSPAMQNLEHACNTWTAAFFVELKMPEFRGQDLVPTSSTVWERLAGRQIYGPLDGEIIKAKFAYSFFHWPVEFADVFAHGGFDVVLGNPPWEKFQSEDVQWFATRAPHIASLAGSSRKAAILDLRKTDRALAKAWEEQRRSHAAVVRFVRECKRYSLTGVGKFNSYALFAELVYRATFSAGRSGIIVPSGIATDDTTKLFFQKVIDKHSLVSLFDFENSLPLFPNVHRSYKFSLLTLRSRPAIKPADFFCFARTAADLRDQSRHFSLTHEDIARLNPNTRTCPIFRTRRDAEITKKVYELVPPIEIEGTDNPWSPSIRRVLNETDDSADFFSEKQLSSDHWKRLTNGDFQKDDLVVYRLYEGKMIWHFDHRYATYRAATVQDCESATGEEHTDVSFCATPRYWYPARKLTEFFENREIPSWSVVFRDITNITNERTIVFAILPRCAIGVVTPMVDLEANHKLVVCFFVEKNSFIFDYIARQKIAGTHVNIFKFKQLPSLEPERYQAIPRWEAAPISDWLGPRALELTYTAWDLQSFARDCGWSSAPFRWDEKRRFLIRSELDAAFFHLYSISRDDVDYIMETFPIVKRKDEANFGEYRTKRVILEIYDEMEQAKRTGRPYQSRLDPPPGDPRAAHSTDLHPEQAPVTS